MTTTKPKRKPLSYRSLDFLIGITILVFLGIHPLAAIAFLGVFILVAIFFRVFPEGYFDQLLRPYRRTRA
jgi:hypothetical protein